MKHNIKFYNAINNIPQNTPPIWFMRQAGRYLSEYRNTRKLAGSFLDLCYNSELATEVTLQPIDKFGFDAAILFADILLILDALGVKVQFIEGQGPLLEPIKNKKDIVISYDKNWKILWKKITKRRLCIIRTTIR